MHKGASSAQPPQPPSGVCLSPPWQSWLSSAPRARHPHLQAGTGSLAAAAPTLAFILPEWFSTAEGRNKSMPPSSHWMTVGHWVAGLGKGSACRHQLCSESPFPGTDSLFYCRGKDTSSQGWVDCQEALKFSPQTQLSMQAALWRVGFGHSQHRPGPCAGSTALALCYFIIKCKCRDCVRSFPYICTKHWAVGLFPSTFIQACCPHPPIFSFKIITFMIVWYTEPIFLRDERKI